MSGRSHASIDSSTVPETSPTAAVRAVKGATDPAKDVYAEAGTAPAGALTPTSVKATIATVSPATAKSFVVLLDTLSPSCVLVL